MSKDEIFDKITDGNLPAKPEKATSKYADVCRSNDAEQEKSSKLTSIEIRQRYPELKGTMNRIMNNLRFDADTLLRAYAKEQNVFGNDLVREGKSAQAAAKVLWSEFREAILAAKDAKARREALDAFLTKVNRELKRRPVQGESSDKEQAGRFIVLKLLVPVMTAISDMADAA